MKTVIAAAVALALAAPAAQATVLSDFLTFDGPSGVIGFPPTQAGGEDKLEDDSLSRLVNPGGIIAGNSFFGVLTLSEILASGRPSIGVGPSSQVAIIYAGTYAAGPGGTLSVVANPALLAATCGGACGTAGITGNSLAVILSTTTAATNPARDPLNWDALGANGVTANFNGANGNPVWAWELTAGLNAAGTFAQFSGDAILGGTNRAGLEITSSAFAANWLAVDVLDFQVGTHLADLTLDVGLVNPASVDQQARGWSLRDQSSLFVNPTTVPLPATAALFGLGLAGLGFSRRKA